MPRLVLPSETFTFTIMTSLGAIDGNTSYHSCESFSLPKVELTLPSSPPGASLFRRLRQTEAESHHETDVDAEGHRRPSKRDRGERGAAAGHPRTWEDSGVLHAGGRQQRH